MGWSGKHDKGCETRKLSIPPGGIPVVGTVTHCNECRELFHFVYGTEVNTKSETTSMTKSETDPTIHKWGNAFNDWFMENFERLEARKTMFKTEYVFAGEAWKAATERSQK